MAGHCQVSEQLKILRRISERGLAFAHLTDTRFVDLFQHLQDEIERTKIAYEETQISSLQEGAI